MLNLNLSGETSHNYLIYTFPLLVTGNTEIKSQVGGKLTFFTIFYNIHVYFTFLFVTLANFFFLLSHMKVALQAYLSNTDSTLCWSRDAHSHSNSERWVEERQSEPVFITKNNHPIKIFPLKGRHLLVPSLFFQTSMTTQSETCDLFEGGTLDSDITFEFRFNMYN